MSDHPKKVRVELGEQAYDVLIGGGVLAQLGAQTAALIGPGGQVGIVADETVWQLFGEQVSASLEQAGLSSKATLVPVGEGSKSFAQLERVCRGLLQSKVERGHAVIALGGGVVGDLAGFAAAILRRGVKVIQVPTSLLAQVDSSVGGKTGINVPEGKNLIGAFHQPSLVLADTNVLDHLPERHLRAGYAEIVKFALLGDANFYDWLEVHGAEIFTGGAARVEAIARAVAGKAGVVSRDEKETGERALLNLGHTFGHALEAVTGYSDQLFHGEGVSLGLVLAMKFSMRLGMLDGQSVGRVTRHLEALEMPTSLRMIAPEKLQGEAMLDAMWQDKKVTGGKLNFILLRAIGQAEIVRDVDPGEVLAFLREEIANSEG